MTAADEVSAMFDDLKRKQDAYWALVDARKAAEAAFAPQCPECKSPVAEHVGRKACLPAVTTGAENLSDLPIFGWAWSEDK